MAVLLEISKSSYHLIDERKGRIDEANKFGCVPLDQREHAKAVYGPEAARSAAVEGMKEPLWGVALVSAHTCTSPSCLRESQDNAATANERRAVISRQRSLPLWADLWLCMKGIAPNLEHYHAPSSRSTSPPDKCAGSNQGQRLPEIHRGHVPIGANIACRFQPVSSDSHRDA